MQNLKRRLFLSPLNPSKTPNLPFSLTTLNSNETLLNYLTTSLDFPKHQAISVSTRFPRAKSLQKPQSVHQFLRNLGFSESQIRVSLLKTPQLLFSDVDKTLKPKFDFFQGIGLVDSDLGKFISQNPKILTFSLHKRLVPCTEVIKKVFSSANSGRNDVLLVLRRCRGILYRNPESRLLRNIAFLESCGIVGSQLAFLLRRQPSVFVASELRLQELVSKALGMGFPLKSRMLVHAVNAVSCVSKETICRKLELFKSYGFTDEQCAEMFKRAPILLNTSEEKLCLGIEFYLNTVKFSNLVLVYRPACLMNSIKERAIPRWRVLEVLMSKKLLKKEPSFLNTLNLTEEAFVDKYISRFGDIVEELLVAYKGHLFDYSEMEN